MPANVQQTAKSTEGRPEKQLQDESSWLAAEKSSREVSNLPLRTPGMEETPVTTWGQEAPEASV